MYKWKLHLPQGSSPFAFACPNVTVISLLFKESQPATWYFVPVLVICMFSGDAEEEAETDILGNGIPISADVYQVGHHGSRSSSSQDFLAAMQGHENFVNLKFRNNDWRCAYMVGIGMCQYQIFQLLHALFLQIILDCCPLREES